MHVLRLDASLYKSVCIKVSHDKTETDRIYVYIPIPFLKTPFGFSLLTPVHAVKWKQTVKWKHAL